MKAASGCKDIKPAADCLSGIRPIASVDRWGDILKDYNHIHTYRNRTGGGRERRS